MSNQFKRMHDNFIDVVAANLHRDDIHFKRIRQEELNVNQTATMINFENNDSCNRYHSDPMFRARVQVIVSNLMTSSEGLIWQFIEENSRLNHND